MRPVEKYWIIYYIVFIGSFAFLLWRHWSALRWDNETYVYLLAAIFGLAAGTALMSAIFVEVIGYMVLLIPARIKQLKEEGRKEGREEGREEGRKEGREEGQESGRKEGQESERQQWLAWYERQQDAFREGRPFEEPPPASPPSKNGK